MVSIPLSKTFKVLEPRALPKLVTTTSSSTSTSTSPSTSQESTSTHSGSNSAITTTSPSPSITSSSPSSSTTTVIPTITPPSINDNPYITNDDKYVQSTVFIAVGVIVGFIFFLYLALWAITSYLNYRTAKKSTSYDSLLASSNGYNTPLMIHKIESNDSDYYSDKTNERKNSFNEERNSISPKTNQGLFNNVNSNLSSLNMPGANPVTDNYCNSTTEVNNNLNHISNSAITVANSTTITNTTPGSNTTTGTNTPPTNFRHSLFISPTARVIEQQQKHNRLSEFYQDTSNTMNTSEASIITESVITDLNKPDLINITPDRRKRNSLLSTFSSPSLSGQYLQSPPHLYSERSRLSVSSMAPLNIQRLKGRNSTNTGSRKLTPSMVLDNLLGEEDNDTDSHKESN
ncbi:pheromone-regulated protein PRM5 NDAI_0B03740 [Naumovozyma dairenensis CBS 421]|uniref:Vacuolar membrane protein n=1 Tax=Naumovozyma dairenensis (strain ATCC 10597 / BCRC 20456 / CBS 421 / NBRC 0211 / NRRL Y-12639) TaxID=1071378 RepID=G0W6J7_NAUDC|nr:hypothetical protein NDAI_0B03740 [Naumovozyma dairenensis CBS 421]CCD23408.1 hypothetical protein NDAI_0B03740 [Naumovozyma dairenensis CBS 421]